MFHAAITIFHPHKQTQYDYLYQLARVRLENFAKQERVTELSIITCVSPNVETFEQLLRNSYGFDKTDVYLLHGRAHAADGYAQMLVQPNTPWTYFCDDGHVIPTRTDSVRGWFDQTVDLLGGDDFDLLVESSRLRREPITKREHLVAYAKWLEGSSPEPTIQCQEWGYYQKSSTLRKYLRPPQWQQTQNGTFFLHQGARVAFSNSRAAWFVHHGLSVGPCSFRIFDTDRLLGGVASVEVDPKWDFCSKFTNAAKQKLLKLTPITRISFEKGKLVSEETDYFPDYM